MRIAFCLLLLLSSPLAGLAQEAQKEPKLNRLATEKSPYLRQHATNPVDWWPWCEEAFAEAAKRDVPVFLSVGYSTCHWCHVMEHESFEDAAIAKLMNESFVCVKLDREERPDIDAVYMSSVQIFTRGAGGWPASIWMFPDKRVFFAGTYFPAENFSQLIGKINEVWKSQRKALSADADSVIAQMKSEDATTPAEKLPSLKLAEAAAVALHAQHDPAYGGFGRAPKFPRTSVHELLFAQSLAARTPEFAAAALHSLTMMSRGGIYDHVGGGFHRYSVDREWLVPHFEKMLYDQALIAATYLDASVVSDDDAYSDVAADILGCLERDFTHADGGFYAAYDADSGGVEGSYYVWSPATLKAALTAAELKVVEARFDVTESGNWHELEGWTILRVKSTWEEAAKGLELGVPAARAVWESARPKLRAARDARPRPGLDDKILVAWNGMAVSAFARAGRLRGNAGWIDRAARSADFIHAKMRTKDGRLLRRWCRGEAAHRGVLRDYAFYGQGLVDLFEATGDSGWIVRAGDVADAMIADFTAEGGGFFDAPAAADDLLMRPRDPYDGAVPSGNSTAATFLLRLAALTGRKDLHEAGAATLRAFADTVERHPSAYPALLEALRLATDGLREIVVIGDSDHEETAAMRRVIAETWLADAVLCIATDAQARAGETTIPLYESRTSDDGAPIAWVCRGGVCKLPVKSAEELRALITEKAAD